MNLGYSVLLKEYIEASKIENTDCKNFVLICPTCNIPLTKGNNTKIFIHENSVTEKCNGVKINIDREKTNEKLQERTRFLCENLEKTIYNIFYEKPEEAQFIINKIANAEALELYRTLRYETSQKVLSSEKEDIILNFFESKIEELKITEPQIFNTHFSILQQKKLALKIWYYLLTEKGRNYFLFLFNHCYYYYLLEIKNTSLSRALSESELYLLNIMDKLITAPKGNAKELMGTLGMYQLAKLYPSSPANLFDKMTIDIAYNMLECLLELPYTEMLKLYE